MNTEIKSAEEILKNKIDNHPWGYGYENIKSTEGTMNDFLNISLSAMKEYASQFKQPDISEDVESEFEILLIVKNELLEADKLPFAKRVEANKDILNFVSLKRKSQIKPIPIVDEDEYNRGYQDGYNKATKEAIQEIRKQL